MLTFGPNWAQNTIIPNHISICMLFSYLINYVFIHFRRVYALNRRGVIPEELTALTYLTFL